MKNVLVALMMVDYDFAMKCRECCFFSAAREQVHREVTSVDPGYQVRH